MMKSMIMCLMVAVSLNACGSGDSAKKVVTICECPCTNAQACESFNGVSSAIACVLPNGITLEPNQQTDYACSTGTLPSHPVTPYPASH